MQKSAVIEKQRTVLFLPTIVATDWWEQPSDSMLSDYTSHLQQGNSRLYCSCQQYSQAIVGNNLQVLFHQIVQVISRLYCFCQQCLQQIGGNDRQTLYCQIVQIICYMKNSSLYCFSQQYSEHIVGNNHQIVYCGIVQVVCYMQTADCTVPANNSCNRLLETFVRFCIVGLYKLSETLQI